MASQHQGIWTQCRDRTGGGQYQNQSWPDGTCFGAYRLPFWTGRVSGLSEHKSKRHAKDDMGHYHRVRMTLFLLMQQFNTAKTSGSSESKALTYWRTVGFRTWWPSPEQHNMTSQKVTLIHTLSVYTDSMSLITHTCHTVLSLFNLENKTQTNKKMTLVSLYLAFKNFIVQVLCCTFLIYFEG